MTNINLTPQEIVSSLDKYIVGQEKAKRSVAIAVRNRWRRMQLPKRIRDEIVPKNILMIGPTGVGKTEIARRLAKLSNSPFVKVEATKFTEVGYVGRDVEQIIRDLVESALNMLKNEKRQSCIETVSGIAKGRVVDVIAGNNASEETKKRFWDKLEDKEFLEKDIEIELLEQLPVQSFELPGTQNIGMINLSDALGKMFGGNQNRKLKKVKISEAIEALIKEETEKAIDQDQIIKEALKLTENNGIVFLDEIDKICGGGRTSSSRGEVSREGVQRDLLPIVEGTTVQTKYGPVKTDFILFIASGAFHIAKPSDLLPELQGRFPIRVELDSLGKEDFVRILTEPEMNLVSQAKHILSVEELDIVFEQEAIEAIADIAYMVNSEIENIGARRLNTIIWQVLNDLSFNAPNLKEQSIVITRQYVLDMVNPFVQDADLSKFIL